MTTCKARRTTPFLLSLGLLALTAAAYAETSRDVYDDPLPAGAKVRLGTLRWRHGGAVVFTAYTADAKGLLTASQDGTVRLWDAESGKEIRRYGSPHSQPNMISCGALSLDGQTVVLGGQDGTITLYEVDNGKRINQMKANPANGIAALAFAADGKTLFAKSYDQAVREWNLADGKELRKLGNAGTAGRIFYNGGPSSTMAVVLDGKVLASGGMEFDNNQVVAIIKLYNLADGKELAPLKGPVNGSQAVAFSPDGKTVAWSSNNNGTIGLWDLGSRKEVRPLTLNQQTPFYAGALAFTPDGKTVAARSYDQTLRLFDVESGKELRQLGTAMTNYGSVCNLAFSADGKRIASGIGFNTVQQWDPATGQEIGFHGGHSGPIGAVGLSPDGKTVATRGFDNILRLWDAATGKQLSSFALPVTTTQVAFAHDGKTVVFGGYDGVIHVAEASSGKELLKWQLVGQPNLNLMGLAVSPDGKTVATRGYEPAIRLWDRTTGRELRQLVEQPNIVNGQPVFGYYYGGGHMAFSPDGSTLAVVNSGSNYFEGRRSLARVMNNHLHLWDVASGKPLRKFEISGTGIASIAFSPDGRTITSSNHNGTFSQWEAASGKERFQFKPATVGFASVLTYSPDGRILAGACMQGQEGIVRLWDAVTGKELASQYKGHQSMLLCLAFAADGKTLVTGSQDSTALLWDAAGLTTERPAATELDEQKTEALWADLANADAKKAYEAIRALSTADKAPTLLRDKLRPVAPPDPQQVAQLLLNLENDAFPVRQKATVELEKLGELAEPALMEALSQRPSLEMKQRIERVLGRLISGQAPPAEALRALRAFEVLENVGGTEAKEVLQMMAQGAPGSRLTQAAQQALNRLGK